MKKGLLKKMFGINFNAVHYFAEPEGDGTILGGAGGAETKTETAGTETKTETAGTETKTETAGTETKTETAGTETETKTKTKTKTETKPEGIEYTDFKFPEGITPDDKLIGGFKSLAKELKLTQEQAQKFVDLQSSSALAYAKAGQEAHISTLKKWREESDQFLGADKEKKLSQAAKALRLCGAEKELREFFDKTGFGNHPAFVKLLVFAGQQIADDTMPAGNPPAATKKNDAETLYGGLKM